MERQLVYNLPTATNSAATLHLSRKRYSFYYRKLREYLSFVIPKGQSVLLLGCEDGELLKALEPSRGVGVASSKEMVDLARRTHPEFEFIHAEYHQLEAEGPFEYIILNDMAGEVYDLVELLQKVAGLCTPTSRVVIHQHNYLWRPILEIASAMRLKRPEETQNWLSAGDISVLLYSAGLETVQVHSKLFMPINPLGLGRFINWIMGLMPFANRLASTQLIVARLLPSSREVDDELSCTICLTTRDERDNIEPMVRMIPQLGKHTEILFVEGHSNDGTREEIERVITAYPQKDIRLVIQPGKGQGDAIRIGFQQARGDIVILLEADQTSPVDDVIKVWKIIASGNADYVNGTRFIYPKARGAMPLLNTIGNHLFAVWFSWFLGQRTTDVLCGIKGISKRQYGKLFQNWGFLKVFDPFGDFELIFGASRLGLRICEVPTHYYPRQHGDSKTSFFSSGWLLAKMAMTAMQCFKCR